MIQKNIIPEDSSIPQKSVFENPDHVYIIAVEDFMMDIKLKNTVWDISFFKKNVEII